MCSLVLFCFLSFDEAYIKRLSRPVFVQLDQFQIFFTCNNGLMVSSFSSQWNRWKRNALVPHSKMYQITPGVQVNGSSHEPWRTSILLRNIESSGMESDIWNWGEMIHEEIAQKNKKSCEDYELMKTQSKSHINAKGFSFYDVFYFSWFYVNVSWLLINIISFTYHFYKWWPMLHVLSNLKRYKNVCGMPCVYCGCKLQ
jgi:hypothetical protein